MSPVIGNAVGRHVVRTRRCDGVGAASAEALTYLGSFWNSGRDAGWEESLTCGWGVGYLEHSVEEQLQDAVAEELFWVRGMPPHAFYIDQRAAADLMDTLLSDERIDYEDRCLLASTLSGVSHNSAPKVPRYWDMRDELNGQFESDETIRSQSRDTIGSEGFHRQLGEGWTSADIDL